MNLIRMKALVYNKETSVAVGSQFCHHGFKWVVSLLMIVSLLNLFSLVGPPSETCHCFQ